MQLNQKVMLKLPQQRGIGLVPLIVAIIVSGIDILFVFLDNIISAIKTNDKSIIYSKGILSPTAMSFQLTWGFVISFCLNFVENSLKWQLRRPKWNVFGLLNAIASTIFILAAIYTRLWSNDAAGIVFIAKTFLVAMNIRTSPDMMRYKAYSGRIEYFFNIIVCWFLPIYCAIVLVDSFICMFRKGKQQQIKVYIKKDQQNRIMARLCSI